MQDEHIRGRNCALCKKTVFSHLYSMPLLAGTPPHVLRDKVLDVNYIHLYKNLKVRQRSSCGSKLTEMQDSVTEGAMQLMLSPALWCG